MIDEKYTLCFSCAKACNSGCTWSAVAQPVAGWTAYPTHQGYMVTECPEFVEDDEHRNRPATFDHDGVMKMLEVMVRQMREDYVWGRGPYKKRADNRQAIERFLMCDRGRKMLQLSEPEEVIRQLRFLARRHDTEMMMR